MKTKTLYTKNPTQNSIRKATKDPIPSAKQDLRTARKYLKGKQ